MREWLDEGIHVCMDARMSRRVDKWRRQRLNGRVSKSVVAKTRVCVYGKDVDGWKGGRVNE